MEKQRTVVLSAKAFKAIQKYLDVVDTTLDSAVSEAVIDWMELHNSGGSIAESARRKGYGVSPEAAGPVLVQ